MAVFSRAPRLRGRGALRNSRRHRAGPCNLKRCHSVKGQVGQVPLQCCVMETDHLSRQARDNTQKEDSRDADLKKREAFYRREGPRGDLYRAMMERPWYFLRLISRYDSLRLYLPVALFSIIYSLLRVITIL